MQKNIILRRLQEKNKNANALFIVFLS